EPGGTRRLTYPIQPDHRGKFSIGPLNVRVADAFGLAKVGSMAAPPVTLVVTPPVTALPRTALAGSWLGDGDARASTAAAAGEDDVVPRAYRDGDELRRVHWRSTARYGELMGRREEQRRRNRAVLFLDTARARHGRPGPRLVLRVRDRCRRIDRRAPGPRADRRRVRHRRRGREVGRVLRGCAARHACRRSSLTQHQHKRWTGPVAQG